MRALRKSTLIALVVMMAGGCSGYSAHVDPSKSKKQKPVSYGGGFHAPTPIYPGGTVGRKLGTKGKLVVTVLDDRRAPLVGAVINFKGPQKISKATDAHGVATVTVKPGSYNASIAPCGTTVKTTLFGQGDFTIGAGQVQTGTIDGITWIWRFTPQNSVEMSVAPPWKVGRAVTLGVRIQDECNFASARNASIPQYSWRLSKNFAETARPTMRADGTGFARISISCTTTGDGKVEIVDRYGRSDAVNLLTAGEQPPGSHHFCE